MNTQEDPKDVRIKAVAAYWDGRAASFDGEHDTENKALWKEALRRLVGDQPGARVLDVGTGTGFLALMLAELGYCATGVDIAEGMMAYGRKKAEALHVPVSFIQSACEDLPFGPGSFDAVVNCRVMWTLGDPVAALREWQRVLAPGGRVISFMRMMDVDAAVCCYPGEILPELPLQRARAEDYLRVYREAGLSDVTAEELPTELSRARDMPGWTVFCGTKGGK